MQSSVNPADIDISLLLARLEREEDLLAFRDSVVNILELNGMITLKRLLQNEDGDSEQLQDLLREQLKDLLRYIFNYLQINNHADVIKQIEFGLIFESEESIEQQERADLPDFETENACIVQDDEESYHPPTTEQAKPWYSKVCDWFKANKYNILKVAAGLFPVGVLITCVIFSFPAIGTVGFLGAIGSGFSFGALSASSGWATAIGLISLVFGIIGSLVAAIKLYDSSGERNTTRISQSVFAESSGTEPSMSSMGKSTKSMISSFPKSSIMSSVAPSISKPLYSQCNDHKHSTHVQTTSKPKVGHP